MKVDNLVLEDQGLRLIAFLIVKKYGAWKWNESFPKLGSIWRTSLKSPILAIMSCARWPTIRLLLSEVMMAKFALLPTLHASRYFAV